MKSYIIGIGGVKGSGKDTFASMINYIVAKGITSADYKDWSLNRLKYDIKYAERITHFADPLKDCLSIMFGIPRKYFDSREHKDDMYWSISGKRFIKEGDVRLGHTYIITIDLLKHFTLSELIEQHSHLVVVIKLRTLMQYVGTEIGKNMLHKLLWVMSTISKAADIAEKHKICIIPDMRFSDEHAAVCGHSLYGQDIMISRNLPNRDDHASETMDFSCTVNIDNNGTMLKLFYKALNVVQTMYNNG